MNERLKTARAEGAKDILDNPEIHDPKLAAEFGRVVMDGYSEPFGADLVEKLAGAEDPSERDLSIVAAMGEKSKTWFLTVDK